MNFKILWSFLLVTQVSFGQTIIKEDYEFPIKGKFWGLGKIKDKTEEPTGCFLVNMKDTSFLSYYNSFFFLNDSLVLLQKEDSKYKENNNYPYQLLINIHQEEFILEPNYSIIKNVKDDGTIIQNTLNNSCIYSYEGMKLKCFENGFINASPLGYYNEFGLVDSIYLTFDKTGKILNDLHPYTILDWIDSNAVLLIDLDSEKAKIVNHKMQTQYSVDHFDLFTVLDTPNVKMRSLIVFENYQTVLLRNRKNKWYDPLKNFSKKFNIKEVYQLKPGFDDVLFAKNQPLFFVTIFEDDNKNKRTSFILDVKGEPLKELNDMYFFKDIKLQGDYFVGILQDESEIRFDSSGKIK